MGVASRTRCRTARWEPLGDDYEHPQRQKRRGYERGITSLPAALRYLTEPVNDVTKDDAEHDPDDVRADPGGTGGSEDIVHREWIGRSRLALKITPHFSRPDLDPLARRCCSEAVAESASRRKQQLPVRLLPVVKELAAWYERHRSDLDARGVEAAFRIDNGSAWLTMTQGDIEGEVGVYESGECELWGPVRDEHTPGTDPQAEHRLLRTDADLSAALERLLALFN